MILHVHPLGEAPQQCTRQLNQGGPGATLLPSKQCKLAAAWDTLHAELAANFDSKFSIKKINVSSVHPQMFEMIFSAGGRENGMCPVKKNPVGFVTRML